MYTLTQSAVEEQILKAVYRSGGPVPDAIANAPDLLPGLELYYQAYLDLDSDRSSGMGVGAIPWTSCFNWASVHGLSKDQFDALIYHKTEMDRVYVEYIGSKSDG